MGEINNMNCMQIKYNASLERLADIMNPIAKHADVQALFRCPYKNRLDECTAKFGCRNQIKAIDKIHCGGDDKIDYRPFWESETPL